ncbi:RNA-directed DNA polymerase (Reverse transcriptase), partial [Fusarium austroafricanum]
MVRRSNSRNVRDSATNRPGENSNTPSTREPTLTTPGEDSIITEEPPVISAPAEENDTEELIRATQLRVAQLEELKTLREKEKALTESLRGLHHLDPGQKPRRSPCDSDSSSGGEVRARNITKLTLPTNFQKREAWLNDLKRAFSGARRRYRRDYKKILLAEDNMDEEARERWTQHLAEIPDEQRASTEGNWEAFTEWSLSLVKDAANREPLLMRQLVNAKQRENQSPQDFHHYLNSLEKNFPRPSERERALSFYAKLLPRVQEHIDLHSRGIPDTREATLSLATRFWDRQPRLKRAAEHNTLERPWKHPKRYQKEGNKTRPGGNTRARNLRRRRLAPINREKRESHRDDPLYDLFSTIEGREGLHHQGLGAEADTISERFAVSHGLRPAKVKHPELTTVGGNLLRVMTAWTVPVTLQDRNGRVKTVDRVCLGIEWDPKTEREPLILSESTLVDLQIVIDHGRKEWWFRHRWAKTQVQSPRQFRRESKNLARIFALVELEEPYPLLDETENSGTGLPDVPREFRQFLDVFSAEKSSNIPEPKTTDHNIELEEGKSPPFGPIYPLSQAELKELWEYLEE